MCAELKTKSTHIDNKVKEELIARDRQIDTLNEEIIKLKHKQKDSGHRLIKERDNEIVNLKEENTELQSELKKF